MSCCGNLSGPCTCPERRRAFGAIEAACTGRYASLVRNGAGGTLNQPCANAAGWQFYCNDTDVEAWHATAWDLFTRVRRAWNATVETASRPMPPVVREYVTALENDYGSVGPDGTITIKLPPASAFNVVENAAASTAIARWCSRAACALELLEDVRGIRGPVETPPEHEPILPGWGGMGGISMVILVAVGLWLFMRSQRQGR